MTATLLRRCRWPVFEVDGATAEAGRQRGGGGRDGCVEVEFEERGRKVVVTVVDGRASMVQSRPGAHRWPKQVRFRFCANSLNQHPKISSSHSTCPFSIETIAADPKSLLCAIRSVGLSPGLTCAAMIGTAVDPIAVEALAVDSSTALTSDRAAAPIAIVSTVTMGNRERTQVFFVGRRGALERV